MENIYQSEYEITSEEQFKDAIKSWKERLKLTYISGSESEDNSISYEYTEEDYENNKHMNLTYSNLYNDNEKNKIQSESPKIENTNDVIENYNKIFGDKNQEQCSDEHVTEGILHTKENFKDEKKHIIMRPQTLNLTPLYQPDNRERRASNSSIVMPLLSTKPYSWYSDPPTTSTLFRPPSPYCGSQDELNDIDTSTHDLDQPNIQLTKSQLGFDVHNNESNDGLKYLLRKKYPITYFADHFETSLGYSDTENDLSIDSSSLFNKSFNNSLGTSNSSYHSFEENEINWDPYLCSPEIEPFKSITITNFEVGSEMTESTILEYSNISISNSLDISKEEINMHKDDIHCTSNPVCNIEVAVDCLSYDFITYLKEKYVTRKYLRPSIFKNS